MSAHYDWYQTDETIVVTIFLKNIINTKYKVNIKKRHLYVVAGDDHSWNLQLHSFINVERSNFLVKQNKLEITLSKENSKHWTSLEFTKQKPVYMKKNASGPPAMFKTNFDEIVTSETDSSDEGVVGAKHNTKKGLKKAGAAVFDKQKQPKMGELKDDDVTGKVELENKNPTVESDLLNNKDKQFPGKCQENKFGKSLTKEEATGDQKKQQKTSESKKDIAAADAEQENKDEKIQLKIPFTKEEATGAKKKQPKTSKSKDEVATGSPEQENKDPTIQSDLSNNNDEKCPENKSQKSLTKEEATGAKKKQPKTSESKDDVAINEAEQENKDVTIPPAKFDETESESDLFNDKATKFQKSLTKEEAAGAKKNHLKISESKKDIAENKDGKIQLKIPFTKEEATGAKKKQPKTSKSKNEVATGSSEQENKDPTIQSDLSNNNDAKCPENKSQKSLTKEEATGAKKKQPKTSESKDDVAINEAEQENKDVTIPPAKFDETESESDLFNDKATKFQKSLTKEEAAGAKKNHLKISESKKDIAAAEAEQKIKNPAAKKAPVGRIAPKRVNNKKKKRNNKNKNTEVATIVTSSSSVPPPQSNNADFEDYFYASGYELYLIAHFVFPFLYFGEIDRMLRRRRGH